MGDINQLLAKMWTEYTGMNPQAQSIYDLFVSQGEEVLNDHGHVGILQTQELYNIFMRNIHVSIPKTKTDPILEDSINRVNEKYLFGLIEKPNLTWNYSTTTIGYYEYGSDTINISKVLKEIVRDYRKKQ